MRTTVDIQDDVLRLAKETAARRGTSLSAVVSDALRQSLAKRTEAGGGKFKVRVYHPKVPGLKLGVDIDDNASLLALP
jgi:hypothetical protein